ncbi:MAG TPA: aminotransferase class I/II-fold pyridoxal phosphate-dependent enzyme [Vicinamibacterales bacterium]|nr:aminotransferase class I/II-fold pyridoxal phosphate-dependent enzyme [Vicinamibacterales bacterium]
MGGSRGPRPGAAWISARGHEAFVGEFGQQAEPPAQQGQGRRGGRGRAMVRLSSNENPLGPSAVAIAAIEKAYSYAGRYPTNPVPSVNDMRTLIAGKHGLEMANVALGAGSGETLDAAAKAFTSPTKGLVTAIPSYESPTREVRRMNHPITEVPVDVAGKLDLEKMIAASTGAGLVFVCNPNNPTATVHGREPIADMVQRISAASPDTVILVDEAYHDYVTDPSYTSAIPLIPQYPNLVISRTFSKAHGMAGLRLGFGIGQPAVIERLSGWMMVPFNANALAVAAAYASLEDEAGLARETARNTAARQFTLDFFRNAGFEATDSQTNFIFVKLGRPAREFREGCAEQGIAVGRDFAPMEKEWARVSIGTQEEMDKAVAVFKTVLNV